MQFSGFDTSVSSRAGLGMGPALLCAQSRAGSKAGDGFARGAGFSNQCTESDTEEPLDSGESASDCEEPQRAAKTTDGESAVVDPQTIAEPVADSVDVPEMTAPETPDGESAVVEPQTVAEPVADSTDVPEMTAPETTDGESAVVEPQMMAEPVADSMDVPPPPLPSPPPPPPPPAAAASTVYRGFLAQMCFEGVAIFLKEVY